MSDTRSLAKIVRKVEFKLRQVKTQPTSCSINTLGKLSFLVGVILDAVFPEILT